MPRATYRITSAQDPSSPSQSPAVFPSVDNATARLDFFCTAAVWVRTTAATVDTEPVKQFGVYIVDQRLKWRALLSISYRLHNAAMPKILDALLLLSNMFGRRLSVVAINCP